jgi:hypothetical protein
MMLKLVQADLRSNQVLILVAALVSPLLWLGEAGRSVPGSSTLDVLIYGQFPFLILFAVLEMRRLAQKRRRLCAQLPVTATTVRISSWLSYLVIIAIASLISAVILIFYPPVPQWGWSGFVAAGALLSASFLSLAALLRIFWLGMFMRSPAKFIVWVAVVLIWLLLNRQWGLIFNGEGPFRVDTVIQWEPLLAVVIGAAFALVLADILLDRLTDNHLS